MLENVWLWGHFLCRFTFLVCVINFYSSSFFHGLYDGGARPVRGALRPHELVAPSRQAQGVPLCPWDEQECYIYQHNFVDWYAAHTFLYLIFQFLGPAAIIMTFNMLTLQALNPRVLSYQTVVQALSRFHCLANPILYNFLSRSFCGNLIANLARHLPGEETRITSTQG
ncbi:G-protein coupled receptor 182-like [Salvelinus alpinus]